MAWYNTYKFTENPLKITPNPNIIGLEKEEKNALAAIDSGDIFQLTGYTGAGKTSLMKKIISKLNSDYTPIYYDCSSAPAATFSMQRLMTRKSFFGLVTREYSKGDKVILFCDEIQKLDKNKTEEIKAFYDAEKIHSVIFSTISEGNMVDSMKSRIGDKMHLSYPEKKILVKMIKKRFEKGINPFTNEALDELIARSGKNPRIILINAEKVCKQYFETYKGRKSITASLVKKTIKPEKEVLLTTKKHVKGKWDSSSKEVVLEKSKSPKEIVNLQEKLSPLQWNIVSALSKSSTGLDYDGLMQATGKSKESLGKQLSRLGLISDIELMKRKGIIDPIVGKKIKNGRPHYDLTDEIRFLLARE